jgi:flagellar protein FlbT
MYTAREPQRHHDTYFSLVRDIAEAAPSTWALIQSINNHILIGEMYKALKEAKKLIAYEEELLSNAIRRSGVRKGGKADVQSS